MGEFSIEIKDKLQKKTLITRGFMQAKLLKPSTKTVELSGHEHLEVFITDTGLGIHEYTMWSEAFEAWITQDIDLLFRTYPTQYNELCDKAYKQLQEQGEI